MHIERTGHWIETITISESNKRTNEIYVEKITQSICTVELSINLYLEFN